MIALQEPLVFLYKNINTNFIGINIINESYNKNYGVFIGEIIENSNYNITFNNEEKEDIKIIDINKEKPKRKKKKMKKTKE